EFNSFLKKPKFTSSLSESFAINSYAGAEVDRSIVLKITQHYRSAIGILESAQNAYVDQRNDLDYHFTYSSPYTRHKLSVAIKAHIETSTALIAEMERVPSDLAKIATSGRKSKSSVPVLTRTAKATKGLIKKKVTSAPPPAPPATAKPYFLDKPVAFVASGVGQVAAEFGRITFAKIEDPSEQSNEQSELSEQSEQLDMLGQEIDGLFEKEFGSALNSISGSPAIEKPVNRRSGAALRRLPVPGNKVDRNATTAIMTTMTTITAKAPTMAKAPTTVPVALGSVAPNTRGWTRKRPTGINGLPHADAEMLKNAAVLKKNRVVPGNKVQASSRPPGGNLPQRSLPPTPGQLAAREKEEESFSSREEKDSN
ncbi:MAG: hypothetical protein JWQ23_1414, partial [Herminiimonas sp.]|nr:hypothetical protein [Herminiimonas sp.]